MQLQNMQITISSIFFKPGVAHLLPQMCKHKYHNRETQVQTANSAWKTNVKRDKSIVTLSTLVKEFNAAFGNDDGRTGIKKEYLAAQQSYINGIEEDESVRVYPKASSQAVPLQKPACSKILIHFPLNLFPYTPVFGQMPLNFGHNMIYPLSPPAHLSSGGG